MSEVDSLLRRIQAAEDKLEGIQDRIDRLEKHMKELRLKLEKKKGDEVSDSSTTKGVKKKS